MLANKWSGKNEGLQNRKFYGNVNHKPRHNNVTTQQQQQQQINQTIELFTHRCIYTLTWKETKRTTIKSFFLVVLCKMINRKLLAIIIHNWSQVIWTIAESGTQKYIQGCQQINLLKNISIPNKPLCEK